MGKKKINEVKQQSYFIIEDSAGDLIDQIFHNKEEVRNYIQENLFEESDLVIVYEFSLVRKFDVEKVIELYDQGGN